MGGDPVDASEYGKVGLLSAAVLAVACVCFFGPGVPLGSELFFSHDIGGADLWHLFLPFWRHAADCGARGELPLWCPGAGTGIPLLAEGQVGALYPPNVLLRAALPLPAAFNLAILFSLVLAGAGASVFARQAGAGRGGSLVAGAVFGLGGFFLVHIRHPNMIAATAWFPLQLFLVEGFLRERRPRTLAFFAVSVALSFLAGHPQMAAYNLLMAGIYTAVRLALILREGRGGGGGAGRAIRSGIGLVGAVLIGILLAAPQLVPSYELKEMSPRSGGLDLEESTRSAFRLAHVATLFRPGAFGDPGRLREIPAIDRETGAPIRDPGTGEPLTELAGFETGPDERELFWEVTAYLGLIPLLLALLARGPRRSLLPLLVILLLGFLLAMGSRGGVYTLLFRFVPGFDLFRFPSRFLVYAAFALAILAGLGLSRALAGAPRLRRLSPAVAAAVLVLCVLDLWAALGDHNPTVSAAAWMEPPGSARRIHEEQAGDPAPFRIATIDPERRVFGNAYARARGWKDDLSPYEPARTTLDPNLCLLFGLNSPLVHSPNPVDWTVRVSSLLFLPPDPERPGYIRVNTRIASILNVRYYVDPFDVFSSLPAIEEYPGDTLLAGRILLPLGPPYTIRLRRNPAALPRAFLAPRARVVAEGSVGEGELDPAQRALISRGFDPRREILISTERALPGHVREGPPEPIPNEVEFLEYGDRRVRLRAEAPQACWLFLSDTFYPGWSAWLDGVETPIYRGNIFGRAVRLPEGRHEIEFVYRPVSFRIGLAAGAVGLLLLGLLGWGWRRVLRSEEGGSREGRKGRKEIAKGS